MLITLFNSYSLLLPLSFCSMSNAIREIKVNDESEEFININVVSVPNVNVDFSAVLCESTIPNTLIPDPQGEIFNKNINANNEFIPTQIGVNDLVYTYENSQGCSTNFNFGIEVLEPTDPQITNVPNSLCLSQNDVYQFIAEPAGGLFTANVNASGEFIPSQLDLNTISIGLWLDNSCIGSVPIADKVLPEEIVNTNHIMDNSSCRQL